VARLNPSARQITQLQTRAGPATIEPQYPLVASAIPTHVPAQIPTHVPHTEVAGSSPAPGHVGKARQQRGSMPYVENSLADNARMLASEIDTILLGRIRYEGFNASLVRVLRARSGP
jgi:hypothetical protein